MSAVDILIVIVFVASLVFGFHKGIIAQLGVLGGILLGIIACRLLGSPLASGLMAITDASRANPTDVYVTSMVANILIFGIVFTAVVILARMIKTITSVLCLSIVDRVAGMLFSLFSWLLALSLLLNIWQVMHPTDNIGATGRLNDGRAVRSMMDFAPDILGNDAPTQLFRQH